MVMYSIKRYCSTYPTEVVYLLKYHHFTRIWEVDNLIILFIPFS